MIELQHHIENDCLTDGIISIRELIHLFDSEELSDKYCSLFTKYIIPFAKEIDYARDIDFDFSNPENTCRKRVPYICKVLKGLDSTEVAILCIRNITNSMSLMSDSALTNLCSGISRSLERAFKLDYIQDRLKINIGLRLLTLFRDCFPDMISWELASSGKHSQYLIHITDNKGFDILKTNLQYCLSIISDPMVPMVVPPKDWESPVVGGYITEGMNKRHKLIRKCKVSSTDYRIQKDAMPTVYSALNHIQSVPWKVDYESYEVLKWAFTEDLSIGKLPSSEVKPKLPYPLQKGESPTTPDQKEVVHKWYAINENIKKENQSSYSKRLIIRSVFNIIEYLKDKEVETLWFPHNLDYRGRVYPITPVFNPQGIDYIKSLLKFKDGKRIGSKDAIRWMAIHGANLYGYDKAPLDAREDWADYHKFNIQMSVYNWKSTDWWRKADKPFQFLAWCREWVGILEWGVDWVSHMPVALDGSCSGIQHYSAMLRDPIGGSAVNLLPSDVPNDIYQVVADKVLELIKEDNSDIAKEWIRYGIDRKLTKRSVMTLPYGLTKYSCREYIRSDIAESGKGQFSSMKDSIWFFADMLWKSIDSTLVGAQVAMEFLRQVASEVSKDGEHIEWVSPTGFPVIQKNMRKTSKRCEVTVDSKSEGKRTYYLRVFEESDKLDISKQVNAICPNFIHSYDASHLIMSVHRASVEGISAFSMIHDSFGTYASDIGQFRDIIRKSFADIYTFNNALLLLWEAYSDKLGHIDIPKIGNLELSKILESDYAFS